MLRWSKIPESLRCKPKAIIFDTDNTLYPYLPSHTAAMAAVRQKAAGLLGIDAKRFDEAFDIARLETKQRLGPSAASHSRLLYLQRTLELLGLRTQILLTLDLEQTYWRTFLANSRLFPDVKEFLIDIKSHGIGTAIITDLTCQIQFRKIVYFGLENLFDFVVTSEEAGLDKPDEAPFRLALAKLSIPPSDIWMIGDNPSADIAGAKVHGITTLQKVHQGVEVHASGPGAPDATFQDYRELRTIWSHFETPAH